jgi:hypothetical protein
MMNILRFPVILGFIALLSIAGCSSEKSQAAKPATFPEATKPATSGVNDSQSLLGVVSNTIAAANTGDFTRAKLEFIKFEESWKVVEDGIKAKSRSNYDAIEESMDKVNNALKETKPDKKVVLDALKTLQEKITSSSKS